ncbi:claudin-4-like isoform X4 [Ciona intestinalis]
MAAVSYGLINISAVLGIISSLMMLIILILPEWRINSVVASEINMSMVRAREGIWIRCVSYSNAYWNCDTFDVSLIGLPAYLNAFRALMIIGFIASLGGVVCSVLGMRCASVVDEESKAKRWIVIIGGLCHIAAGVLTGICVSWYAAEVVWEYYSPYYQTQKLKYTLGACLYVGWIAMLFALVAGCLMTCCACCNKPADSTNTYSYNPAKLQAQNHSYPEPTVYRSEPVVEKAAVYDHRPDYYRSSSKSKRSKYSKRRDEHSSSESSSRSNSPSRHSRSHKSRSSRHASDSIRASGFV